MEREMLITEEMKQSRKRTIQIMWAIGIFVALAITFYGCKTKYTLNEDQAISGHWKSGKESNLDIYISTYHKKIVIDDKRNFSAYKEHKLSYEGKKNGKYHYRKHVYYQQSKKWGLEDIYFRRGKTIMNEGKMYYDNGEYEIGLTYVGPTTRFDKN